MVPWSTILNENGAPPDSSTKARDPHEVWDAPHWMGGDVGRGDPLAGGGFAPNPPEDSPEGGRRRHLQMTRFPDAMPEQARSQLNGQPRILMVVDRMVPWPTILDENGARPDSSTKARDPHEVWDAPHWMGGDVGRGDPPQRFPVSC